MHCIVSSCSSRVLLYCIGCIKFIRRGFQRVSLGTYSLSKSHSCHLLVSCAHLGRSHAHPWDTGAQYSAEDNKVAEQIVRRGQGYLSLHELPRLRVFARVYFLNQQYAGNSETYIMISWQSEESEPVEAAPGPAQD